MQRFKKVFCYTLLLCVVFAAQKVDLPPAEKKSVIDDS